MNVLTSDLAGAAPGQLDPFALWPTTVSRITGIGGTEASPDPHYAFHTQYDYYPEGPVEFLVKLEGLQASEGTLTLTINEHYASGQSAEGKIIHAPLPMMAAGGGTYRITFDAREDVEYALHGRIYGTDQVSASGISILADRRMDASTASDQMIAARKRIFGTKPSRRLAPLVSSEPATLEHPVSQMCTASQMDDAIYERWTTRMGQPVLRHRKQWEFVFVARTLEYYGMLEAGRRGVGFGVGVEPLPAVFAADGVFSVATDLAADDTRAEAWSLTHQHGRQLADLRNSAVCPDDVFDAHVSFEPVDMNKIPDHLRDFDFCWSSCAFEHLGSIAAGLRFVEESLKTLKPGGIAVHTTELNLTSNFITPSRGSTVLFRKRDFERLALVLTARGHQVMPIKFDQGEQPDDNYVDAPPYCSDIHLKVRLSRYVSTSFGIVVRKGDAPAA